MAGRLVIRVPVVAVPRLVIRVPVAAGVETPSMRSRSQVVLAVAGRLVIRVPVVAVAQLAILVGQVAGLLELPQRLLAAVGVVAKP